MKLSINLRNWGPLSTPTVLRDCARAADQSGLDSLWINEHIAIPPDLQMPAGVPDFADGRNLDPFATLAFLSSVTRRIGLGTAVVLIPYRPALPTAKLAATVQELSGGRLRLGIGVGWMKEEFKALGIDFHRRGELTDNTLSFIRQCFDNTDRAEANGQPFVFKPRPPCPPIYVGGNGPHCLKRTVQFGDGWIPAGIEPDALRANISQLRRLAEVAGKAKPEVIAMKTLPINDPPRAIDYALQFAAVGADHVVHTQGYQSTSEYLGNIEILEEKIRPALEN